VPFVGESFEIFSESPMRTIKVPESTEGNIYCYGTGMWLEGLFCFHSHNQTSAPMPWSRSLAQLPTSALSVCVGSARARGDINIHAHTHNITRAYAHSGAGNELSSIHHAAARALKSLFDVRIQIVSLIGFHEENFTTTLPFIYFTKNAYYETRRHIWDYIPNAPRAATNKRQKFQAQRATRFVQRKERAD
jgi:hypothetical protein